MIKLVQAGRSPDELEFEPTAQSIRNWVAGRSAMKAAAMTASPATSARN